MLQTSVQPSSRCQVVVLWIDWYAYHVARFVGLQSAFGTSGEIVGIEMVGGVGVHDGLKFRESLPAELPVETLFPNSNWKDVDKVALSRAVWNKLTELDPEVVLVPGYYTLPAITAAVWARKHKRVSVLMTESTEQDHARSFWKEKLKSVLIRKLFGWAVTGGAAHVRYLQALKFPAERISSFYNVVGNGTLRDGVNAMRSAGSAAYHGLPDEYLLYVGRLAPEKNVDNLIRSWADYRRQGGVRSLLLVGDGESAASLRQLAEQSGFAHDIVFAGHKGSRELWSYYAFASAFVLPSTREPWGLVVNEAMAAGLPIFVSSHCGCAENLVEGGQNGYIFDPSRMEQLTEHMLAFDNLSQAERNRMAAQSCRRIAAYTPDNFGKQIAAIAAHNRAKAEQREDHKLSTPKLNRIASAARRAEEIKR